MSSQDQLPAGNTPGSFQNPAPALCSSKTVPLSKPDTLQCFACPVSSVVAALCLSIGCANFAKHRAQFRSAKLRGQSFFYCTARPKVHCRCGHQPAISTTSSHLLVAPPALLRLPALTIPQPPGGGRSLCPYSERRSCAL